MCVCVRVCVHMCVYTYLCMLMYVCACVHLGMHLCAYVCAYACMCVSVYVVYLPVLLLLWRMANRWQVLLDCSIDTLHQQRQLVLQRRRWTRTLSPEGVTQLLLCCTGINGRTFWSNVHLLPGEAPIAFSSCGREW